MFNKNEIILIVAMSFVIAFTANFLIGGVIGFLWTLLAVFAVIVINVFAKKIAGFYLEAKTEIRIWEIEGIGIRKRRNFKKPFPLGAILPLFAKILLLPVQGLTWMASLVFDVKPHPHRAARRHGLYTFSEMTEEHMAYIAAAGIFANLVFSIIGYLVGFTEFAKLNLLYSFFNMIPISHLDGNKIFFGKMVLWVVLACLVVIGLFFMLFII